MHMHLGVCVQHDGRFDLIVIGGGPAGATAATLVSLQGHRVLLLEKERFPRYQIGESLIPVTVHAIGAMLGLREEIQRAGFVRKNGGTFRWGIREEPWSFKFGGLPDLDKADADYAYHVERARFDQMLLDNARRRGVDVRERHAVTDVIDQHGRVSGVRYVDDTGKERHAQARFVVDASGSTSTLYHRVGARVYSEFFRNVALFCYFENAGRMPGEAAGNVLSAAFREGWFWFIPLSDTLTSVGLVIARDYAHTLQQDHEAVMRRAIDACPLIKRLLAPATRITNGMYGRFRVRRDYSYTSDHLWRPGLALVGDAACFVDPVFSTGVHLATYAALLAARTVNTVLAGDLGEEQCFVEFERRYRAEFENLYKFLIAFYDVHQDEESYYWSARKIVNSDERANEAFIRLVSGCSTAETTIFETGRLMSEHMQAFERAADFAEIKKAQEHLKSDARELQKQILFGLDRLPDRPRFADGLIPSRDGFRWTRPDAVTPS